MKKLLLSALAATASLSMMAALPTVTAMPSLTTTFNITQTVPAYNNPTCWDINGSNWYVTGTFDDSFTLGDNTYEAIGTSSYIIKYIGYEYKVSYAIILKGAATITAIDTDSNGNFYIAGTLADEVEFGTTKGEPTVVKGYFEGGNAVATQEASFVACYSEDGVLKSVKTFVPTRLEECAEYYLYPSFTINHLKVVGKKVYCSAIYTGKTTVDDITFSGDWVSVWGFMPADEANASVFTLSTGTLEDCEKVVSLDLNETRRDDELAFPDVRAGIRSLAFDVVENKSVVDNKVIVDEKIYVGFSAQGEINVNFGAASQTVSSVADSQEIVYALMSEDSVYALKNTSDSEHSGTISDVLANSIYVCAIGSFENFLPAKEISEDAMSVKPTGVSDIFVMRSKISDIAASGEIMPYAHSEGTTMIGEDEKPNYELSTSAFFVNNALYINSIVYSFNQEALKNASFWCDGGAYSDAEYALAGYAKFFDEEHTTAPVMLLYTTSTGSTVTTMWARYTREDDAETSGIESVEVDVDNSNAPVEYYNLQGIRVAEPANGIFIRRQGTKVEKILVK